MGCGVIRASAHARSAGSRSRKSRLSASAFVGPVEMAVVSFGAERLTMSVHLLAGHQRQRVDEGHRAMRVAGELGRRLDHHAARARAGQDDVAQVLVEEQPGHLAGVRGDGDAGTDRVRAARRSRRAWATCTRWPAARSRVATGFQIQPPW
jgi:hypothetical protein